MSEIYIPPFEEQPTSIRGSAAEIFVQYRLTLWGIPTTIIPHVAPYDLLSEIHGHFLRVQVKSTPAPHTKHNNNSYRFRVETRCGSDTASYNQDDFDILALFAMDCEQIYFKPCSAITGKKEISIKREYMTEDNEYQSLVDTLKTIL